MKRYMIILVPLLAAPVMQAEKSLFDTAQDYLKTGQEYLGEAIGFYDKTLQKPLKQIAGVKDDEKKDTTSDSTTQPVAGVKDDKEGTTSDSTTQPEQPTKPALEPKSPIDLTKGIFSDMGMDVDIN